MHSITIFMHLNSHHHTWSRPDERPVEELGTYCWSPTSKETDEACFQRKQVSLAYDHSTILYVYVSCELDKGLTFVCDPYLAVLHQDLGIGHSSSPLLCLFKQVEKAYLETARSEFLCFSGLTLCKDGTSVLKSLLCCNGSFTS